MNGIRNSLLIMPLEGALALLVIVLEGSLLTEWELYICCGTVVTALIAALVAHYLQSAKNKDCVLLPYYCFCVALSAIIFYLLSRNINSSVLALGCLAMFSFLSLGFPKTRHLLYFFIAVGVISAFIAAFNFTAASVMFTLTLWLTFLVIFQFHCSRCSAEQSTTQLQSSTSEKQNFLKFINHEMLTPLSGIIGISELYAEDSSDSEAREQFNLIASSARSLVEVLDKAIDFASIGLNPSPLKHEGFSLRDIIRETIEKFSKLVTHKELTFTAKIADDVPDLLVGDAARVSQVISGVMGKLADFIDNTGEITVEISIASLQCKSVALDFAASFSGAQLTVDEQQQVLSSYLKARENPLSRYSGGGLGLSLASQLIKLMGGSIGVAMAPDSAPVLKFVIPLALKEELPHKKLLKKNKDKNELSLPQPYATAYSFPTRELSILVAEDDPSNQELLKRLLESEKHSVTLAQSGLEVLEQLEREVFDLVLMNCQMPSLDGYETTQRIRKNKEAPYSNIPIIAVTAQVFEGDRERCLEAGMNGYLAKPIVVSQLREALRQYAYLT